MKMEEIKIKSHTEPTSAGKQYAVAYAMQYKTKNLHQALDLYRNIITAHPNTQEAAYSRAQTQNIVNAVVPKQELFEAQVDLALARFEHTQKADN